MKASDLMIGDWCKMKLSFLETWFIDRVMSLSPDNDLQYEPIPLTADQLEKNANGGFGYYDNKSRATYHLHKGKEDVSIYVEWERVYPEPYIELHGLGDTFFKGYCDSVSKLQHALRLCGLADLADNFRV